MGAESAEAEHCYGEAAAARFLGGKRTDAKSSKQRLDDIENYPSYSLGQLEKANLHFRLGQNALQKEPNRVDRGELDSSVSKRANEIFFHVTRTFEEEKVCTFNGRAEDVMNLPFLW